MANITIIVVNARNPNEKMPFVPVFYEKLSAMTDASGQVVFSNVTLPGIVKIRSPMMQPKEQKILTEGTYTIAILPALGF